MGSKKAPKQATPKTSAAVNSRSSLTTHTALRSSILKSSFAPHRLNAPLFASVIQGLDSQHIRIHDTSSGQLCCEHATTANTTINCLDWGYLGNNHAEPKQDTSTKKRKRSSEFNSVISATNIVLAYGTSDSEIHVFSPTESKILKSLKNAHSGGIRDFKFQNDGRDHQAYSVGGDGKVVQWDLKSQTAIMTLTLPSGPASALRPTESKIICALHSAYIMDPKSMTWSNPYNVSSNNVHTVLTKDHSPDEDLQFITIAETDHFVNVFDEKSPVLNGSLRTENEILAVDLWSSDGHQENGQQEPMTSSSQPKEALVILNRDGVVEVFPDPFHFGTDSTGTKSDSLKARMKQRSRKSVAQVKMLRPDQKATLLPLINASFQDEEIMMAWVEEGINVNFDLLKWRDMDTGRVTLNGSVEIVQEKSGRGLGAVNMNGVKDMGRNYVNESQAIVIGAMDGGDASMDEADPEVIDISSAEEDTESEDDESEADEPVSGPAEPQEDVENEDDDDGETEEGKLAESGDESMPDAEAEDKPQEEAGSPSFGDLLRTNAPEAIDVSEAVADGNTQSLTLANPTSLRTLPAGMSLSTVLTQSLRTNDTNLLETCLHTRNLAIVRSTIERLDSSFATDLLQRLAERIHSRPGRAGSLMVWIQWTLVAHGGYLAGQPEVMRKLRSLHKVVKERAGSLQSLLNLKGKLDMLEAQMNLRRSVLGKRKKGDAKDEDEEEAVIYVEGQEVEGEDSDSEEDSDESGEHGARRVRRVGGAEEELEDEYEGDDDDGHANLNGVLANAEYGSDSDEGEMEGDEQSETDKDSDDELEDEDVDHASADTDSSNGDASPPPPAQSKVRLSNGVRS